MGNDNVIEFNGKRYDALTGKVIGSSHTEVVEPLAPPVTPPLRRQIDGVVRRRDSAVHPRQAKPTPVDLETSLHEKSHHPRKTGSPAKAHRPQPTKTLMRRAVHKPKTVMKPAIKPQAPAEVMAKPISTVALKHSVHHVDPSREHRARKTPKNQAVTRFASPAKRPVLEPIVVAPTKTHHHSTKTSAQQHAYTKADIFEAAIANAHSHEQPAHIPPRKHKRGHRTVGILIGIVSLLTLGGVVGYLNLSNIRVKVASVQAGFDAQLPSYQPTGYVLGAVTNSSGNVALNFRSGEKHYTLTQQPTDWNSQTLSDNITASADAKTIESQGRIIYIYNDVATWISGGVRYDLTGNAELDPDEVAAIAASL